MITHGIDGAVRSSNVASFIGQVYELEQGGTERLREAVAAEVAEEEPCIIAEEVVDEVTLLYPQFGCDGIEQMRRRAKMLRDVHARVQLISLGREKSLESQLKNRTAHVARLRSLCDQRLGMMNKMQEELNAR